MTTVAAGDDVVPRMSLAALLSAYKDLEGVRSKLQELFEADAPMLRQLRSHAETVQGHFASGMEAFRGAMDSAHAVLQDTMSGGRSEKSEKSEAAEDGAEGGDSEGGFGSTENNEWPAWTHLRSVLGATDAAPSKSVSSSRTSSAAENPLGERNSSLGPDESNA